MRVGILILTFTTVSGCAGYAHWTDYQQGKKIKEIEERLNTLEHKFPLP